LTVSKEMRNRVVSGRTPRTVRRVRRDVRNGDAYGKGMMRYFP